MSVPHKSAWKTRLEEREFPDRSFDIEFWQEREMKPSLPLHGKWWN
jgi:hypothetical protein